MSKLSNKIRIVSSDGDVLEEAGKGVNEKSSSPEIVEKESVTDKVKGIFGKKKEEEPVEDTSDVIGRPEVEETVSIMDRVKNTMGKDKGDGYDDPVDLGGDSKRSMFGKKPRKKTNSGGQPYAGYSSGVYQGDLEDVSDKKKKSGTPMLIGIILALAVVSIAVFIYLFNNSAMAAVDVEPQQIEDSEIAQALEDGSDGLSSFIEGGQEVEATEGQVEDPIAVDVPNSEEDSEIKVDTPQEKEQLIERIEQLEVENKELESKLKEALGASQPEKPSEPQDVEDGWEGSGDGQ